MSCHTSMPNLYCKCAEVSISSGKYVRRMTVVVPVRCFASAKSVPILGVFSSLVGCGMNAQTLSAGVPFPMRALLMSRLGWSHSSPGTTGFVLLWRMSTLAVLLVPPPRPPYWTMLKSPCWTPLICIICVINYLLWDIGLCFSQICDKPSVPGLINQCEVSFNFPLFIFGSILRRFSHWNHPQNTEFIAPLYYTWLSQPLFFWMLSIHFLWPLSSLAVVANWSLSHLVRSGLHPRLVASHSVNPSHSQLWTV